MKVKILLKDDTVILKFPNRKEANFFFNYLQQFQNVEPGL